MQFSYRLTCLKQHNFKMLNVFHVKIYQIVHWKTWKWHFRAPKIKNFLGNAPSPSARQLAPSELDSSFLRRVPHVKLVDFIMSQNLWNLSLFIHRYKEQGNTGMAIMDIGILTGFAPDKKSLQEVNIVSLYLQSPRGLSHEKDGGACRKMEGQCGRG